VFVKNIIWEVQKILKFGQICCLLARISDVVHPIKMKFGRGEYTPWSVTGCEYGSPKSLKLGMFKYPVSFATT